jgi:hypothetical protein
MFMIDKIGKVGLYFSLIERIHDGDFVLFSGLRCRVGTYSGNFSEEYRQARRIPKGHKAVLASCSPERQVSGGTHKGAGGERGSASCDHFVAKVVEGSCHPGKHQTGNSLWGKRHGQNIYTLIAFPPFHPLSLYSAVLEQNEMHMGLSDNFHHIQNLKVQAPVVKAEESAKGRGKEEEEDKEDDEEEEEDEEDEQQEPTSIFEFDKAAAVKQMEKLQLEDSGWRMRCEEDSGVGMAQEGGAKAGWAGAEALVPGLEHLDEVD